MHRALYYKSIGRKNERHAQWTLPPQLGSCLSRFRLRAADSDGDGQINLEGCSAAASSVAWPPLNRARLKYLIERFDHSDDGMVNLAEFEKMADYLQRGHAVQGDLRCVEYRPSNSARVSIREARD